MFIRSVRLLAFRLAVVGGLLVAACGPLEDAPAAVGVSAQALQARPQPRIAGGTADSFYVAADGSAWAFGSNLFGKLGDGSQRDRVIPVSVSGLTGVVAVSGGGLHTLALLADGTVRAWGYNNYGQLGDGTFTMRTTPVIVAGLSNVVAVAAGASHSLALLADGTVRAWGENYFGTLGDGNIANSNRPVVVSGLSGVVAIAAGGYFRGVPHSDAHSLALLRDGTVRAWGSNNSGQLGIGSSGGLSTLPLVASGLANVTAIAAGSEHSLALLADGTVRAWGSNLHGQLGNGDTGGVSGIPSQVVGLTGATAIATGAEHSLALVAGGAARGWGYNYFGQLGIGGLSFAVPSPAPVHGLTGAQAVAAGAYHSLALLADGAVRSWGHNYAGQLGDGTTVDHGVPATSTVPCLLQAGKTGGSGVVGSFPAGITCGADCAELYPYNTALTLSAQPDPGYLFSKWIGCDSVSSNICRVQPTGSRDVLAVFVACVPLPDPCGNRLCGAVSDGCGSTIQCGECDVGQGCFSGQCR